MMAVVSAAKALVVSALVESPAADGDAIRRKLALVLTSMFLSAAADGCVLPPWVPGVVSALVPSVTADGDAIRRTLALVLTPMFPSAAACACLLQTSVTGAYCEGFPRHQFSIITDSFHAAQKRVNVQSARKKNRPVQNHSKVWPSLSCKVIAVGLATVPKGGGQRPLQRGQKMVGGTFSPDPWLGTIEVGTDRLNVPAFSHWFSK